ncbi:MAG: family 10 glycosylhydrolase [Planctomycetaceae bacterium]|nr:family 10 glycosylhydrolase [Planctomycetaceae bacterium]
MKTTTVVQAEEPIPQKKILLSSPLTFTDWVLRHGTVDEEGIRYVLQECKNAGLNTIYWRVFDAGYTTFPSQFADSHSWSEMEKGSHFWGPKNPEDMAVTKRYAPNFEEGRERLLEKFQLIELKDFDTLKAACKIARELGISMNVWYTLNEDDHGYGHTSRFAKEHPQYVWVKRDGTKYHSQMSFAWSEVREYKLKVLEELLEYDVDGVFFDWVRTGDIRDDPQSDAEGTADFGYEEINIQGFMEKYGIDPREIPNNDERWVKYRTLGSTEFMREAHKLIREKKPDIKISAMIHQPWAYRGHQNKINGSLYGLCLDVETWAKEKLIDSVVAAGYYMDGGNATLAYEYLKDLTHGQVDVWLYRWIPNSPAEFQNCIDEANALKAKQILFWEADYIDGWANEEEMNQAMGGYASP